ncbi:ArsR/SmtB family transcription factor [Cellulomonas xiejunii]|uniref:ArsR/SmtB family transcription factor n=1 Tax=Cellulomonas xiejunii TaxID=2968083 RepID=UPI001D0E73EA|nr:metalloregulator ArsR/SmtB family transcription factor [Cellulomonas xiejunii]MCC2313602.1 metalloregulator ArsR/SmtB family transcription factor [Cellulomonas xiejunii]
MPLDPLPVDATEPSTACCPPLAGAAMTAEDAARTARSLKALADPARLRLLSIIAAHAGGEACVCDLTEPLGLSQPTVSHHLKVLTEAGFVTREKRGVWAYYTLAPAAVQELTAHLGTHLLHSRNA